MLHCLCCVYAENVVVVCKKKGNENTVASLMSKQQVQAKLEDERLWEDKNKKKLWNQFLSEQSPLHKKINTIKFVGLIVNALIDGAVEIADAGVSSSGDTVGAPPRCC